jgi:hypothetical protein
MTSEGTGNAITERAGQAARTTQAEASKVAETVTSQTREVVQEAKEQARSSLQGVMEDTRQRANEQAQRFAESLRETSTRLHAMADAGEQQESGGGFAATLVRETATAAERLSSRLEQGGTDAFMADMRSWARRRPGSFLMGAAVTGFVAGRLFRNMNGDAQQSAPTNRYADDWYATQARETVDLRDSNIDFEPDPGLGATGGPATGGPATGGSV